MKNRRLLAIALAGAASISGVAAWHYLSGGLNPSIPPRLVSDYPFAYLPYQNMAQGERALHQFALDGKDEQMWMSDGELWVDVRLHSGTRGGQINFDAVLSFMNSTESNVLFFYHNHSFFDLNGQKTINPPSTNDLTGHILLTRESSWREKRLVSRVVDPFVVWEYRAEDRPDIPDAKNLPLLYFFDNPYFSREGVKESMNLLRNADGQPPDELAEKILRIYRRHFDAKVSFRPFGND